jgi:hypothetical protein
MVNRHSILSGSKREESYVARPFDGNGKEPLVARAISGNAAGSNLTSFTDKLAQ